MTTRHPHTARISLVALMQRGVRHVPLTAALIVLNMLVFVLMAGSSGDWLHFAPGTAVAWGANFSPATQDKAWWRLLSALFVHLGLLHLAVNLWALWDIGRMLEGVLGRWRFAWVYLASGVVGNVLLLALQDQPRVSGGASGAIFGLYGALIVFLWRERTRIAADEYRWIGITATLFSALMLGAGLFIPSMDNAAHAGGFVTGLVLSRLLGHAAVGLGETPGLTLFSKTGALSVVAITLALLGLSRPPYRYAQELQARSAIVQYVQEDQRITARWQALVAPGAALTFEQLAGALQAEVVDPYQRSFDALASVEGATNLPSGAALLHLQSYAERRHAQALRAAQALQRAGAAQSEAGY